MDHTDGEGLALQCSTIERIRSEEPRLIVGAGTILTPQEVKTVHRAGVENIISPGFPESVIEETRNLDMVSMTNSSPGVVLRKRKLRRKTSIQQRSRANDSTLARLRYTYSFLEKINLT